jgi:hypothetical protein
MPTSRSGLHLAAIGCSACRKRPYALVCRCPLLSNGQFLSGYRQWKGHSRVADPLAGHGEHPPSGGDHEASAGGGATGEFLKGVKVCLNFWRVLAWLFWCVG